MNQDPLTSLDDQLRALPARRLDPRVDAQSLRAARAVLSTRPRGGALGVLRSLWSRALAPALLAGTVASYLVWAVGATGALYH